MPKAVTASRRDNFEDERPAAALIPCPQRFIAERRVEQELLLAVIETLRAEVDSLKLSLGRERLLRQQAEHEAERVNRGLDAIVPNRRGNVPGGGGSSGPSSGTNSRRVSKEL